MRTMDRIAMMIEEIVELRFRAELGVETHIAVWVWIFRQSMR